MGTDMDMLGCDIPGWDENNKRARDNIAGIVVACVQYRGLVGRTRIACMKNM
jgi:hypothetical protein